MLFAFLVLTMVVMMSGFEVMMRSRLVMRCGIMVMFGRAVFLFVRHIFTSPEKISPFTPVSNSIGRS